jgi:hypothetical protein
MALNNHEQAQIREYLLGKLTDAEQEKIEERLMLDDELFDEFEVSKDELVEEYCAGELGHDERKFFEEHFLASAEGRQRRMFAVAMDCLHQPVPIEQPNRGPELQVERRITLFERLAALIKAQPWATAAVTAVIVLAVVIAGMRFSSRGGGQTFNATLTTSALRRGGEGPLPDKLHLPPNTNQVRLRLQLPKPAAPGTRYKAEVDDRVKTKPVDIVDSDPQSVTVTIPTQLIPHGEYSIQLTVSPPDGSTQELSYLFNVD